MGRFQRYERTHHGECLVKYRRSLSISISVALALLCMSPPVGAEVVVVPSPHSSLSKTRKLLDALDVRVMLSLDFQHAVDIAERGELLHGHGVIESRLYVKARGTGSIWMEIAIFEGVGAGYDLAL